MPLAQIAIRLALLIAVIGGLGLFAAKRISFDTDPLEMLPDDLPEATGLQLLQKRFGKDIDLMVTIEGENPEHVESAAKSLTEHLLAQPGLVANAHWRPPGAENSDIDPLNFAELIAYAWMNAPPESWEALLAQLSPENSKNTLTDAFDTLAYGQIIDPQLSMFRASTDPLGVVHTLPEFEQLLASGGSGDKEMFQALDGKFRLVRAEAPNNITEYKLTIAWLEKVEPAIRAWQANSPPEIRDLTVDWTGRAPYTAEIASAMEREMKWSVVLAIILIHTLFFIFYRRFMPIIWLVLCLALTFTITLTIGSFIFEDLGATSVGFAAILIGLAVDYGFVIYQESLKHGSDPKPLRRRLAYSIGWAAVTTAAVFIGLRLSSLTGAAQLGTMVGIGITVGALTMLTIFTWLNHLSPPPVWKITPAAPDSKRRDKLERLATSTLAIAAIAILLISGTPVISASADDLRPKDSHAADVFETVWEKFGWGKRGGFQVVIAGQDEAEVALRIQEAQKILADDQSNYERDVLFPPSLLLANPANQDSNRQRAQQAIQLARDTIATAGTIERPDNLEQGHVEDMLGLTNAIFQEMQRLLETPAGTPLQPTNKTSRWLLDNLLSREPLPVAAVGTVQLPERTPSSDPDEIDPIEVEELRLAEILGKDTEGIYPAGWPLLRPAIVRIMNHEFFWVVIPMAGILLVMLWLAFRRLRRVALSLAALTFSFVCLLSVMSLMGAKWNLMNLAAIPLLLGAGLDYSIHMQLALRRLSGDTAEARRTIGRALVLCGLSTATGFGTLAWSSNAGLASLGQVCSIGIIITMLTCVFLLPAWYRWTHPRA